MHGGPATYGGNGALETGIYEPVLPPKGKTSGQFWPHWIRIQGYGIHFLKKFKTNFWEKIPFFLRKLCHRNFFLSAPSLNGEFSSSFVKPCVSNLSYIYLSGPVFGIRIRIHKGPEYGSNLYPDPQPCCWIIIFIFRNPRPRPHPLQVSFQQLLRQVDQLKTPF